MVYTKYMLGIDLLYFPWLCAYVNVSYLPTLSTFLIGSYRVEITIPGAVSGILRVRPRKAQCAAEPIGIASTKARHRPGRGSRWRS